MTKSGGDLNGGATIRIDKEDDNEQLIFNVVN